MRTPRGLSEIVGMPKEALTLLRDRRIFTDDDFWNQLAADSTLVSRLPVTNPLEKDVLVAAMTAHSIASATSMTSSRLLDHVPDLLLATAALAFAIALATKP